MINTISIPTIILQAKLRLCTDCKMFNTDAKLINHLSQGSLPMEGSTVYSFNLQDTNSFQEVIVPTASYRMGVPNMGLGVSHIGEWSEKMVVMMETVFGSLVVPTFPVGLGHVTFGKL